MSGQYPKISVITPSYNQASFLEATLLSVLDQNYPNLEYFVIDGGSTDGSVEILKRYSDKLTWWVSEKDTGQSNAINKGFARCSGEIVCWINSDDLLLPGTLEIVAKSFSDQNTFWLTGNCHKIDAKGGNMGEIYCQLPRSAEDWLNSFARGFSFPIVQPSTFWRRSVLDQVGFLDEKLHYSFDHEFLFRILSFYGKPVVVEYALSAFRLHGDSKTVSNTTAFNRENRKIARMHFTTLSLLHKIRFVIVYFKSLIS